MSPWYESDAKRTAALILFAIFSATATVLFVAALEVLA